MSVVREFLYVSSRKALFAARGMGSPRRALPNFMLIGAQKSGTSSMFSYLRQHAQIVAPVYKEPYYFDRFYDRGLGWYGCNFPALSAIERKNDRAGKPHLTFEATATYVFDAKAPERIAADVDTRKFILLLRNPVDRAISAYWHARRMGRDTRTLDEALDADFARYDAERTFEEGRGPEPSEPAPKPTYVRRGIYRESVIRWHKIFGAKNLLVLQSETMFADPQTVMAKVFAFLNLPAHACTDFEAQNVGGYRKSDESARERLSDFYRPHNEALNALTGNGFTW
jgi:hypothetical protein